MRLTLFGGIMVQYQPSTSNEVSIVVRSVQVNTTLTLAGPAEVYQGATFGLTASLKRGDTGAPISGAAVKFYMGSALLGSGLTDGNGVALYMLAVNEAGTVRFTAAFEGATVAGLTLMPSVGVWSYTVGGLPVVPILLVLGALMVLRRR